MHNKRYFTVSKHTTHPCEVNLFWGHNHSTTCAKALISDQYARTQLHTYFGQGHSPSSALHLHHLNLAIEYNGRDKELDLVLADRQYIVTFTTHSKYGGGIGESEDALTESFSHLRSVLPTNAFYGRGNNGPQLFITDDSEAEKNALNNIWPEAKQILCIFHYLQCWWKWLWDNAHGILLEDRQSIMHIIRSLVYNRNEVALELQYKLLLNTTSPESYTLKYPQLVSRLESFWDRRLEWALAYRALSMTRGNNTNNYAEASIRVLKEIVFGRVKAYNLIQMFDFVVTTMEIY